MVPAISFDTTSRVLRMTGEVGPEGSVALQTAIEEHSNHRTEPLVVDLTGVTYLPSAAVGMLFRVGRDFAEVGTSLEFAAATGSTAQRVLTVCAMPHRAY
jgi:anti-anti-sigma factor